MSLIINIVLVFVLILFSLPAVAQSDSTGEVISTQAQLDDLLLDLSNLRDQLKKEKRKSSRALARKIFTITRKIDRAVKTIPPEQCLKRLRVAMNDFFELVSDLGIGISCGPSILPPFLGEEDEPLVTNCLPPPEDEPLAQIGGPFSEVLGVYNSAREVFLIDINGNEIPDTCEEVGE